MFTTSIMCNAVDDYKENELSDVWKAIEGMKRRAR